MNQVVIVLAHAIDSGAESVATLMTQRLGADSVRVVRPEVLSLARWSHRVNASGRAATRLQLPHGPAIDDADVSAVLNRIHYLSVPRFRTAAAKDREYACTELQALVASWLAGFGHRVVHAVHEHPWVTPAVTRLQWTDAAIRCGIPMRPHVVTSSPRAVRLQAGGVRGHAANGLDDSATQIAGNVLVAGDQAYGPLSPAFGSRCVGVARRLRLPLLECRFALHDGNTVLSEVTPFPSLAEPWATEAVADLLESVRQRNAA